MGLLSQLSSAGALETCCMVNYQVTRNHQRQVVWLTAVLPRQLGAALAGVAVRVCVLL